MAYQNFLDLIKLRRSNYTLSAASPISDDEIKAILKTALDDAPSAFGSYTTRLVLLLKDEHRRLWDIVMEVIEAVTPPRQWCESTRARLESFRAAYGTVLYLEDPEMTRKLEDAYPFLRDFFAPWSEQTSAMHQFIIWTAFSNAALGANLQHYNPVIDERVKEAFGIPPTWNLIAQMPFGLPTAQPKPKNLVNRKPTTERLYVHGA